LYSWLFDNYELIIFLLAVVAYNKIALNAKLFLDNLGKMEGILFLRVKLVK